MNAFRFDRSFVRTRSTSSRRTDDPEETMPETVVPARSLTVSGIKVEVYEQGSGPPLLFLHPHTGNDPGAAALRRLARDFTVVAPSHPSFGRSDLPRWMKTVDDLSYFYLDLIETLDLRKVTLVGA